MSLSSLRSLTGAATLAFDTARTTLKAISEAAVPAAGEGTGEAAAGSSDSGPEVPVAAAGMTAAQKIEAAESRPAGKPKGVRQGVALDAYA